MKKTFVSVTFFWIIIFICYSSVQTKKLGYSGKIVNSDKYKVISIEEGKSLYIVCIQRNDSSFKVISEKVKVNDPNCKMIKEGEYYSFDLNVIFPSDTLLGLPVIPNLGIKGMRYKESTVYVEDKSHNKLYKANNMEGLCLSDCNHAQIYQDKEYVIQKDSSYYTVKNGGAISSLSYKISNTSCDTALWLWLEEKENLSDSLRIKDYFFKVKGDASLYQIATDPNAIIGTPEVFSTFLKCINPKDEFEIQVVSDWAISDSAKRKVFDFLDNHVVVLPEKKIPESIIRIKPYNNTLFYGSNIIVLFLNSLNLN